MLNTNDEEKQKGAKHEKDQLVERIKELEATVHKKEWTIRNYVSREKE